MKIQVFHHHDPQLVRIEQRLAHIEWQLSRLLDLCAAGTPEQLQALIVALRTSGEHLQAAVQRNTP